MAAFPVQLIKLKKTDCVFEGLFQYNDGSNSEFMTLFEIDLSNYKCKKSSWIEFWDWDCHPQGNPLYKFLSHTVAFTTPGTTYYARVDVINEEEDGECLNLTFNCKVWSRSAINPVSPVNGGGKGKFWIGGIAVTFGEAPDLAIDFVIQICCKDIDDAPKQPVPQMPADAPPGTTGYSGPAPEFYDVDPKSGCYKECKIIAPKNLI